MTPERPDEKETRSVTPHREAHALTIFRILKNGEGRRYTATTFPRDPWQGCERAIRTFRACGWIRDTPSALPSYGVLDVLNGDGDIVQDYAIPTSQAFQAIKRYLHLAVERLEEASRG